MAKEKEEKKAPEAPKEEPTAKPADAKGPVPAPKSDDKGPAPAPESDAKGPVPAPSSEPDWKDQYARLLADFDNFKKRTARDREDTFRFAEQDILKDILPTTDNLALALANAANKDDEFVKGVQLVYDTLLKALKDHGAEPFDCVGESLDTEKMEAIATLPNAEVDEGKVSIVSKRGWMLRDKVLRAAQVVVSSGKPE